MDHDFLEQLDKDRNPSPIGESDPVGAVVFFAIVVILLASCS